MAFAIRPEMTLRPSAQTNEYTLMIHGDIGESYWSESVSARQVVDQLKDLKASTALTIRINSFGGSVVDGLAIYNALRDYRGSKTVVVDGIAASAASLIAMAGDSIEMPETSMMMIHGPSIYTAGNSSELRQQADVLDKFAEAMLSAYTRKTGMSDDEARALLTDGEDHWYTGAEAVAAKIADKIRDYAPEPTEAAKAALNRAAPGMKTMAMAAYFGSIPTRKETEMSDAQSPSEPVAAVDTPTADATASTTTDVVAAAVPAPVVLPDVVADVQARTDEIEARAAAQVAAAAAEAAEARAKLGAEVEAREAREAVEAFKRDFVNLPGDVEASAKALRVIAKQAPDALETIKATLASANALLADGKVTGFEPVGAGGDVVVETAGQKIDRLAAAHIAVNSKLTKEQARSMVYTEHPELVDELRNQKD